MDFWRRTKKSLSPRGRRGNTLSRLLRLESLENRRVMAALPFGAVETDLGEFMLGSVAVTPIFLESNGQLDASTEDWDANHIQDVLTNIETGLDWWVDLLATRSTIHELSFNIDTTYALAPAETRYEGISRRSNDYSLYVAEFLSSEGFSSGNLESDIRGFNQSQREKLGTDWSFSVFVVPSQNDSDGQFAAGGSFSRAFAFAGGLFMVVPSTRPASTYTHETGHMFWARDEYIGGGSYFSRRGYYNTQNSNAADNPTTGFVQQPSIMASGTLLETAYSNHQSPDSTLAMLGWQDSDGDQIFDVLDVPHRLSGSGYLQPSTNTYRFEGQAVVQTMPNMNSSGLKNDITINKIREIQVRFDGGAWETFSLPDSYVADLDLSIPVPSGKSLIEIRARDSKTTVTSNVFTGRLERADATLVPGINGFAWIDQNNNGLRDAGEFGEAGWRVDVLDSQGNALSLSGSVEPDDYPAGVLASDFRTDLTLRSVGSDADGRVGVFADTGTSTGSKTFRGFSLASQTFINTWTGSSRRLQVDFSTPTSVVSIDAIGPQANAYGRLEAYNSSGQLVGRTTTKPLGVGEVQTMTLSRGQADIAYVIAGGHMNSNVKLDNLRFGPATTTTTGPNGQIAFPAIPAGSYTVRIEPGSGYRALAPANGQLPVTVLPNTPAVDVDFGLEAAVSNWQNPRNPLDVSNDQVISALDILLIINVINVHGIHDLRSSGIAAPPYIDVSGDNLVSPLDILRVVNFMNARAAQGEAEGDAQPVSTGVCVGADYAAPAVNQWAAPPVDLTSSLGDEEDELLAMLAREQASIAL